jgi:hypothetical protein
MTTIEKNQANRIAVPAALRNVEVIDGRLGLPAWSMTILSRPAIGMVIVEDQPWSSGQEPD